MVIFNHTNERGFSRAFADPNTLGWIWDVFVSTACKAGVPIFFMISGANLIGKDDSIRKCFFRVRKIFIVLFFWSIIYYGADAQSVNWELISDWIKRIVSMPYWHLWYLYAYIAFLCTLPLLRKIGKNINKQEFHLIMAIGLLLTFVMPIMETFTIPVYGELKPHWLVAANVLYPLVGFYVDKKINIEDISKQHLLCLWIINACMFIISGLCEHYFLKFNPGNTNELFLCSTDLITAINAFVTVKYLCFKKCWQIKKGALFVGRLVFGIYLIHILLLWKIPFLLDEFLKIEKYSSLGIFASVLIVFLIAAVMISLLKHVPVIKRIV